MPTVLLSAAGRPDELSQLLREAGWKVLDHALGSVPRVEFGRVAAVLITVGDQPDAALAQTRRWRAELDGEIVPISWIMRGPDATLATRALEAGADAVMYFPLDESFLRAHLANSARMRAAGQRLIERTAEVRLLGEQLHKCHSRIDSDQAAARRLIRSFLPRNLPTGFAVSHRSRSRSGGDYYDVRPLDADRVRFCLADALGPGPIAGLLGLFAANGISQRVGESPVALLEQLNRDLVAMALDDRPVVAILAGMLDSRTGALVLARAGMPAPVFVPAAGAIEDWSIPGPFLGTADAAYLARTTTLRSGDKLLIGTDGIHPDGTPAAGPPERLRELAERHRERSGQDFVDAVARDLLAEVRHEEDFTLLLVEGSVAGT